MPDGIDIDARGLKCPLPVLKLEKHLATMPPAGQCTLLADDPIARVDIPLLCKKGGHSCAVSNQGSALRFEITKASG
jgi:tRNA 2-thiouridine synthesizing protein A